VKPIETHFAGASFSTGSTASAAQNSVQLQVSVKNKLIKKHETCITKREGELGEREVEMGLRKLSRWV
jgi:hypothetical protein